MHMSATPAPTQDLSDFHVMSATVFDPLGYKLSDEEWREVEEGKAEIQKAPPGQPDRTDAIDRFNRRCAPSSSLVTCIERR